MRKNAVIFIVLVILITLIIAGASLYSYHKEGIVKVIGEFYLNGNNRERYENELIVYTVDFDGNEYGYEVLVDKSTGCVIKAGANVSISNGSYVLSGHGTAADFLRDIEIGDIISIGHDRITVKRDLEKSNLARINIENQYVDGIIEQRREGLYDLDYMAIENVDKGIDEAISEFKKCFLSLKPDVDEIEECYDRVMCLIDEKYYLTIESRAVEARGLWHRPNASSFDESTLEGVKAFADRLAELGINTLYVETFWHGMTTYYSEVINSQHSAMASYDYGEYGNDYTLALISECHKRGIEVHAWVELLKAGISGYYLPEHIKGEWLCVDENGDSSEYFLDPANSEVRCFLRYIIGEMLEKYDFDGISYDYIRYSETGISPTLANGNGATDSEKVDSITSLVGEISTYIRSVSPETVISVSPYGYVEHAKSIYKQDIFAWIELGYIDVVLPMIYTENEELLLSSANEYTRYSSSVLQYTGISPLYNGASLRKNQELISALKTTKICGVSLFASQNYLTSKEDAANSILSAMSVGSHRGCAITPTSSVSEIINAWSNELLDRYERIYMQKMTNAEREAIEKFASDILPFVEGDDDTRALLEALGGLRQDAEKFSNAAVSERICEQIDYITEILNASLSRQTRVD